MSHIEYHWSFGPISMLRAGPVWALDIGRLRLYGVIGVKWSHMWLKRS